ncbi:SDR family NAD(P)-dependent oxidoreductase [Compostimonas suwonensis]|uniref:Short-subunit dehydrogenase n=1 Tax=Compostimonas suwonensis TaxID=1048394 RepID=A0A2M9BUK8_9MICO|nr:SDR family NAD(P)-dependent oxidoreductase [Compostimonas suwonensis]PJJ61620.1 short-subunit dehydrogenase [Compostimonas suwonensis]
MNAAATGQPEPRTIVITGASSGIGAIAAARLAEAGARVAVVGRNPERTRAIAERVGGEAFLADFDHLDEVRGLAAALLDRFERIDVLANNAGGLSSTHELTADGIERTWQTNVVAPFLLTELLLPRLRQTAQAHGEARVLATASSAARFSQLRLDDVNWQRRPWWGGWRAYGTSKLAVIVWIKELAKRLEGSGVGAWSFHPGFVTTGFGATSRAMKLASTLTNGSYANLAVDAEEGAVPLVQLASAQRIWAPSGTFFDRLTADGTTSRQSRDPQLARDLWPALERLSGLDAGLDVSGLDPS